MASSTPAPMTRPAGAGASLLLVRVEPPASGASSLEQQLGVLRARPVDPRTLEDVPGFTPLELGHHYRASLSPDGRRLALVVWPISGGGSGGGGVLHLVDPVAWTDRATEVRIDENLNWLEWSADGTRLYWMHQVGNELNGIFAADLATLTVREIARLPAGFQPYETRLAGSRIAVLGATNARNLAKDGAAIVFVDSASGRITSQLRISGMRLGQFAVEEAGLYPYRMILPGTVWDLARGRLVLVDGEREMIRVVDLARETESGPLAIAPLMASKGPPGGAKMVSTTRKAAALSPDGRWLYVSGLREDVPASDPGHVRLNPIALQRIDLASRRETARIEAGARALWLTADATHVLAVGEDVTLHDASDLRELARLMAQRGSATRMVERGGAVYVAFGSFSGGSTIRALNLATGTVLAGREVDRHVADLIDLP